MFFQKRSLETTPSSMEDQTKIKFITDESPEEKGEAVKRRMVVINGHPYYQSTGRNSGLSGIWLPFLGVKGSVPVDISLSTENFSRTFVIASYTQSTGWLIKKH